MRISDWSSDVCSSDLRTVPAECCRRCRSGAPRRSEQPPLARLPHLGARLLQPRRRPGIEPDAVMHHPIATIALLHRIPDEVERKRAIGPALEHTRVNALHAGVEERPPISLRPPGAIAIRVEPVHAPPREPARRRTQEQNG